MRPVFWNDGTRWSDPNFRWGSPSFVLEEGDPGWTPPPGYQKKKPFRRQKKTTTAPPEPLTTSTAMPTFKYYPAPNPQGGYRTWVVLGPQVTDETLLGLIATDSGASVEVSRAVCLAFFANVRKCTAGCAWSDGFLGEYYFRPTSGGSRPAPEDFQNAEEANADIAMGFVSEKRDEWRGTLVMQSTGTRGLVTPVISTVICMEDGAEDHYVVSTMVRLVGSNLRFNKAMTDEGVFFIKADNTETRSTVYGTIDPGEVLALVPAALTGTLRLRIAARLNGSLRSFTYSTPLT